MERGFAPGQWGIATLQPRIFIRLHKFDHTCDLGHYRINPDRIYISPTRSGQRCPVSVFPTDPIHAGLTILRDDFTATDPGELTYELPLLFLGLDQPQ